MIRTLLKTINKRGWDNNFTADEVREAIREWLETVAEEHDQFPETKDDPAWDLTGKDFDPEGDEDSFVAWVFEAKTVTFAAGRAQGYKSIIRFCEHEFEGDATEVVDALKARFNPVEVRSFPRAEVERWLQR